MKHTAVVLVLLLPLAACSGLVVIISPTGVSCASNVAVIPSPTRPPPRTINTGVTIYGTLSGCHLADEFNVAVVTDGTLVVRLSWGTTHTSTVSFVSIDGVEFRSHPPDLAAVVAKAPATRGQQYRLRVALRASDEIPEDRYQLTTSVE